MLSSERKSNIATDTDNLTSTRRDINQSMRDHDKKKWANSRQGGREKTNKDHFGVKEKNLENSYQKGKGAIKNHLPSDIEKAGYYTKKTLSTGIDEGLKMGFQQAVGIVLFEVCDSIFKEVKDIISKGLISESLWNEIKIRLKKTSERVIGKWNSIFSKFAEGFLSGFISNIVNTLINTVISTGKNIVRMIREGVFSLLKALKMIFFPPENMTPEQAKHEGLKMILSGCIVIATISLSEFLDKSMATIPILKSIAGLISTMISGLVSGISISIGCYLLDKFDFFDAIKLEEHNFIISELEHKKEQLIQERIYLESL